MRQLKFRDGKFRILCFSDSHGIKDFDTRVVRDIEAITEGTKPDLVLFLGDNVWRDGAENEDTLRAFMTAVTKPLTDRGIPWAHVFGNHDMERGYLPRISRVFTRSFPAVFPPQVPKRFSARATGCLK